MDVEILLNKDGFTLQDTKAFAINTANAYNCIDSIIDNIEHRYVELRDTVEIAVKDKKRAVEIDVITACNMLDIFYNALLILKDGKM